MRLDRTYHFSTVNSVGLSAILTSTQGVVRGNSPLHLYRTFAQTLPVKNPGNRKAIGTVWDGLNLCDIFPIFTDRPFASESPEIAAQASDGLIPRGGCVHSYIDYFRDQCTANL